MEWQYLGWSQGTNLVLCVFSTVSLRNSNSRTIPHSYWAVHLCTWWPNVLYFLFIVSVNLLSVLWNSLFDLLILLLIKVDLFFLNDEFIVNCWFHVCERHIFIYLISVCQSVVCVVFFVSLHSLRRECSCGMVIKTKFGAILIGYMRECTTWINNMNGRSQHILCDTKTNRIWCTPWTDQK